jgi:hypothetical protein
MTSIERLNGGGDLARRPDAGASPADIKRWLLDASSRYACRTLDRRDPEAFDLAIGDHHLSFEREDSGAAEQAIPAFPQPGIVGGG